jgi:hypothetical protein
MRAITKKIHLRLKIHIEELHNKTKKKEKN